MDSTMLITIGAGVLAVAVLSIAALTIARKRQDSHLHPTFGTEYDATYAWAMDRRAAREELKAREERVGDYALKEIPNEQRMAFLADWQSMRASFVDHPGMAVNRADILLGEVMLARGYETRAKNPDERIADIAVGHGDEAGAYRDAVRIAALNREGRATTEDLRRAIEAYEVVFEASLYERQPA